VGVHPGEPLRHDSDNGIVLVVELDGFADDVRIAVVVTAPELISQDGDGLRVLVVRRIGWKEIASQHGGKTKELEGVAGEGNGLHVLWNVTARNDEIPAVVGD